MEEIFKQAQYIREDGSIEIYENYEVSNLGRVKSLGNNKTRKEKILKQSTNDKGGHQQVSLSKNNKQYFRTIHRLVLSTFNPEGYFEKAVVDHIDSNGGNNNLSNLRWLTQEENSNTEHCKRATSKALKGNKNQVRLSCIYDGRTFGCIKEAYWYAQSQGYTKSYDAFKRMIKKGL